MNIGLCVGTSPGSVKTKFLLDVAEECLTRDYDVDIFLFDDGIYNALDNKSVKCVTNKLKTISENNEKVNVNVCVNMAKFRGVNEHNIGDYVEISSLISFSALVNKSDIVITSK